MKQILIVLFFIALIVPLKLTAQKPVYPIIFIHGINSSDKTWEETIEFMKDNFGWDDPYSNKGIYHAVLNANY